MQNHVSDDKTRRTLAHVSSVGTAQVHLRNPYVVAWWSAAFPGFGHLLLSKNLRGLLLFLWEVLVNVNANLNEAMVYSFTGQFHEARAVLSTGWWALYIPVYMFAIWDSYRTAVDLNKVYKLADWEHADFQSYNIKGMEVNYLDKRPPAIAAMWSCLTPGLGQLYLHRLVVSFFVITWFVVILYQANMLHAVNLIVAGQWERVTGILDVEWLLFLPSIYGFSIYDAYINAVENNKLFEREQKNFLRQRYQGHRFNVTAMMKPGTR